MSIKCGHCHEQHDTSGQVLLCSRRTPGYLATDQQKATIANMRAGLGLHYAPFVGTVAQGSREIQRLSDYPKPPSTKPAPRYVLNGRFAIRVQSDEVRFYKIDSPTEGAWRGYTFVSVIAGDNHFPVRSRSVRQHIIEEIMKDPKEAMLLFGQEIGQCGHCGRQLTNEESRRLGIGPICRAKLDW